MVLDPLFMFVILPEGNEVVGAAIATALKCGIPSFFLLAAGQISNFFLNGMIADIGASAAVAGIGVVRKIDSLAYAVNQGITQGMLPIVAYCYASNRIQRMKSVVVFSSICTLSFSLLCSVGSYIFAPQLIKFFINNADTIYYGTKFLRVLCIAVAIYPILFVIIAVFQAVGQSAKPFLLSLLHKGSLDIVLFFCDSENVRSGSYFVGIADYGCGCFSGRHRYGYKIISDITYDKKVICGGTKAVF